MSVHTASRAATVERAWWKEAVFYQVYPRSFADGNGDGIGDLIGVIERLGYLADLGVDAIWLSPRYSVTPGRPRVRRQRLPGRPSRLRHARRLPHAPRGRPRATHPGRHRSGPQPRLRSASLVHKIAIEPRERETGLVRVGGPWWSGPTTGCPSSGDPPGSSTRPRSQYYYHCFLREQPDLNYRNPEVRAAIRDVVRFWLDLGVDGLRLDAPDAVFEDAALRDHTERRSLSDLRRGWILARTDADGPRSRLALRRCLRVSSTSPRSTT